MIAKLEREPGIKLQNKGTAQKHNRWEQQRNEVSIFHTALQ